MRLFQYPESKNLLPPDNLDIDGDLHCQHLDSVLQDDQHGRHGLRQEEEESLGGHVGGQQSWYPAIKL